MSLHSLLAVALAITLVVVVAVRNLSYRVRRGRKDGLDGLEFGSARDVLQYMKEERIGYIAVEGGARWEAKDLKQQGLVNLLRERYFELHAAEQKQYFSELSGDHVAQARELMRSRPQSNLRGYRQQLMKLMIYIRDGDCLQEIRAELAAIQPKVEEEQVRAALDGPPSAIDDGHLALLENFLEANPRWSLARELEAEIDRVRKLLAGSNR